MPCCKIASNTVVFLFISLFVFECL
ncbi:MAG: hypothetical protein LBE37_17565 [Sphingobacterium sp.]|nr:hypothetical protein [Sphingobacterium sp.]